MPRGRQLGLVAAAAIGSYYLYTERLPCRYYGKEELKGKVFILTGATNPGIGKETARELARHGATVILGAKNQDRCHQARQNLITASDYQNRHVECRYLDLKSLKSVRKFVEDLPKDLKLSAVINAAETVKKDEREETEDGLEKQMGVSHFGHFLLSNLLVQKYADAGRWRIVSVTYPPVNIPPVDLSDINSEKAYKASAVYEQAKVATLLTTMELARRLEDSGITANAVYPGLCNTEVYRHVSGDQPFFIKALLQPVLKFLFTSPERACQSVLFAALSPKLVNLSGMYIRDCEAGNLPSSLDEQTARRLWELSEKVVADPGKFVVSKKSLPK